MLDRVFLAIEKAGMKKHGCGVKIAEMTGYSRPQVSNLLSGKDPLNDRFIRAICLALNVSEEWIRTGQGEMAADPGVQYGVKTICREISPEEDKIIKAVAGNDDLLDFLLRIQDTPELLMLLKDAKEMTEDQLLEYVRAGRKALREGK